MIWCCASTISRAPPRPFELSLGAYEGRYPVELLGGSRFPRIGSLPYLLTLAPHGFFWFALVADDEGHGREDDRGANG